METFLAIDLGGTKLLVGELDRNGTILAHKRYPATYQTQREAIDLIKRSLDDYVQTVGWKGPRGRPEAFGVGVIGRVNPCEGVWLQIDPARTETIAIAAELGRFTGLVGFVDNDVKAATRAVRHYELASDDFIYINVGTGIAAGMVVGGQLIRGSHFNAGEVGHTAVGVNVGVTCGCGRANCVEQIAAGMGFDGCARKLAGEHKTALRIPVEGTRVDVREVCELAQKGDELCSVLVDNAASALAGLIMNLTRVSDPDTVVLGGGVVQDEYLHARVIEKLNAKTMRFVTGGVVLTRLDPKFIGLIGAGVVAMNIPENRR